MGLDLRKMRILQAIVDDYILMAAPVGSRTISKHPDIALSSATIRNEMSDLEEHGFLEQPHTSAGRIPSDKAYRYYVNSIMQRAMLTKDEVAYIEKHFTRMLDDVEEVVKQTAWALSNITKYASMVLTPQLASIQLRHIQLVPLTPGKALVVAVTDAGIARDSIIRVPKDMTGEKLEQLSKVLTKRFGGSSIDDINAAGMEAFGIELGENREYVSSMLDSIKKSIYSNTGTVELYGATNLLNYPEYSDVDKAKALLSTIENKEVLYRALQEATKVEFSVTIGSENEDPTIKDCSVVTATYRIGDKSIGSMGVIGPTRMDYARVLSVLEYMGKSLSQVLTNMIEEEKD